MLTDTLATRLGAVELARSIASGDLTARAVVDAHIERIEEVDDVLNAVVLRRFAEARREADAADAAARRGEELGPLHGVPVTIKDQFDVAGLPTTWGISRFSDRVATHDGPHVAALRAAGAIVLGKTNVPQTLSAFETDNHVFGRTANPWDPARTPGASGGGDAAILAAGGAALALGADMFGSIRLPAAWCGLAGLKPTAGRLSIDPAPIAIAAGTFGVVAQPGPYARRVADVALAFRVLVEAQAALPNLSAAPVPHRDPAGVELAGMRVALVEQVGGWTPAPAFRRALATAVEDLRARGAEVVPWTGPDPHDAVQLAFRLFVVDGFSDSRRLLGGDAPHPIIAGDLRLGRLPNGVLRVLGAALRLAGQERAGRLLGSVRRGSAADLVGLLGERNACQAAFTAALDAAGIDALLTPATAIPATPHGRTGDLLDVDGALGAFNVLGMPAGVVPVSTIAPGEESDRSPSRDRAVRAAVAAEAGSAGLPVGVQVVARHWREDVALALMAALEEAAMARPDYPTGPGR